MTTFRYRAYDAAGGLSNGEISAPSEEAAIARLAAHGKHPIELHSGVVSGQSPRWWDIEIWSSNKRSTEQIAAFLRDLSELVAAQVPLEEALRLMRNQGAGMSWQKDILAGLHTQVVGGMALSDAMALEVGVFPGYVVALVRSGERSGRLGIVLQEIAADFESSARQRAEIGEALLYPAILLVAAIAALTLVVTVLVPTMMPLFRDAGVDPPRIVALLSSVITLAASHGAALLGATVGLISIVMIASRAQAWIAARDRLILRTPGVRDLVTDSQICRFAHTLSTLTSNGVPMLEAVRVMGGALDNSVFRKAVLQIEEALKAGNSLSESMTITGLFPPLTVKLVSIGERTRALDAVLQRISLQCRQRLDRRLRSFVTLLAPVLTLLIGGIVGGLILSVMSAINGLNDLVLR